MLSSLGFFLHMEDQQDTSENNKVSYVEVVPMRFLQIAFVCVLQCARQHRRRDPESCALCTPVTTKSITFVLVLVDLESWTWPFDNLMCPFEKSHFNV